MDDVIIMATLLEIFIKNRTIHWIPTGYNITIIKLPQHKYIHYCCNYFTVVIFVYLIVLYLFCMKWWFSNLSLFHIQTKDSNMYAYVHSWSSNDGDRNQQNN